MIFLDTAVMRGDLGAIIARFDKLPKHIAKKHLLASMKKAIKVSNGVQVLKSLTPRGKPSYAKAGAKRDDRGRYVAGSGKWRRTNGALRKAVQVRAKYLGTNKAGRAVAALGYKYGTESRKAIWLEFGTRKGIDPRRMAERATKKIAGGVKAQLLQAMLDALEKAPKELGYNPTRIYGAGGKWRAG